MQDTSAAPASPRRVGRPARITRQDIAEAAHQIGLTDLTLRAVADHLGVSVAGLYHHIDGKDDLLRLAAEYSSARAARPVDRGQHWSVWLMEWAVFNRDVFQGDPGLLRQYVDGAVSAQAIADNMDVILAVLVRQGFTIRRAFEVYTLVSSTAIGSAVNALHEQAASRDGRPALAEYLRELAQRPPEDLVHLRALVAEMAAGAPPTFRDRMLGILTSIAVEQGEDPASVRRRIRAARFADDHASS